MAAFLCFALLFISALCRAEVSMENNLVSFLVDLLKETSENSNCMPVQRRGEWRKFVTIVLNVTDPEVKNITQESMEYYDSKEIYDIRHKVVNITSGTLLMLSENITRINFEAIATVCTRSDGKDMKDCPTLPGAKVKTCVAIVDERNKLYSERITVSCADSRINSKEILTRMDRLFKEFVNKYQRKYVNNPDEYARRFLIFKNNLGLIKELNENELGTAIYGVNDFADISLEEFVAHRFGLRPDLRNENSVMQKAVIPENQTLPEDFDWRERGAVTPVYDQGHCGSSWAFSVTGNIEGQYKIKYGKLTDLSEQQLIDCDKLDLGCNGGHPNNAFRIIQEIGGMQLEADYAYKGKHSTCEFDRFLAKVQITSAVKLSSNEVDMQKWLVKYGPISIGINPQAMAFYKSGVSRPSKLLCNPTYLTHAALIVGYGTEKDPESKKPIPYWIIKNSWGTKWGESGYYRVYKGEGTCGVNQMVSSAII